MLVFKYIIDSEISKYVYMFPINFSFLMMIILYNCNKLNK